MAKKKVVVRPPVLSTVKKSAKKATVREIANKGKLSKAVERIDTKLSKKTVTQKDVQDVLNDPAVKEALANRKGRNNVSPKKAAIVRNLGSDAQEQRESQQEGVPGDDQGGETIVVQPSVSDGPSGEGAESPRYTFPTPRKKAARSVPANTQTSSTPTASRRPSWIKQGKPKQIDYGNPPANWQQEPLKRHGIGQGKHLLLRARAGTGKTFTTVLSVAYAYRDAKIWVPGVGTTTLWGEVKRNLGFDPVPSEQQAAVWDFIAQEQPQTVRYCAFNRSIVKSFGVDYKWLVDALNLLGVELKFSTIHSMGFGLVSSVYRLKWGSTKKYKTRNLLSSLWNKDLKEVWDDKFTVIKGVEEMVRKIKISLSHVENIQSAAPWMGGAGLAVDTKVMEQLAFHYGIDLGEGDCDKEEIFETSRVLLNHSRAETTQVDYEDHIWMPIVNNLNPYRKFDLGLIDEGQDLNKSQQELAFKFMDRIVIVGDDKQAIYGFAGADTLSLSNMKERMQQTPRGAEELSLTVTRRCGKKIVALAKELVPDFEAHEQNPEGSIETVVGRDKAKAMMKDKDMVLCRTNAPIVSLAFSLIREGRQCHIQGRDIGQGLKDIIKQSKAEEVMDFVLWLDTFEQTEVERLQKRRIVDEDVIIALQDKCACLRIFCEGSLTLADVYLRIDQLFQIKDEHGNYIEEGEEKDPGIKLSSGHRAKGLEAKRVFVLRPEKIPHPMAKTAWAKEQEMNLKYVIITRAIDQLIWVRTLKKDEADG